jgi:hypothetical protein
LPNLSLAFGKGGRAQTKILIPSVNTFDRRYELLCAARTYADGTARERVICATPAAMTIGLICFVAAVLINPNRGVVQSADYLIAIVVALLTVVRSSEQSLRRSLQRI